MEEEILQPLLARVSQNPISGPAPTDAELQHIFATAACAPDHKGLMPWRFLYFRSETGQKIAQQLGQQTESLAEDQLVRIQKAQGQLAKPLVLVVVAKLAEHPNCPQYEQVLTVGAATMNVLNAIDMLGYSAFWSSTLAPVDKLLAKILNLAEDERLYGLIAVGSVPVKPIKSRTSPIEFAREIKL